MVLAEQVRERTDALNHAMEELKISNKALNRAREEAETTRHRLVDAIESIADGFVLFDNQHRLIQSNSRFRNYWNYCGLQVPEVGTTVAAVKRRVQESGLIREEHTNGYSEGAVFLLSNDRWVQMTERTTREGGLVVLYSDITDVKNSEMARRIKALEESERWIRVVTDHVPALIAYVGDDLTIQFSSSPRFFRNSNVYAQQVHHRIRGWDWGWQLWTRFPVCLGTRSRCSRRRVEGLCSVFVCLWGTFGIG